HGERFVPRGRGFGALRVEIPCRYLFRDICLCLVCADEGDADLREHHLPSMRLQLKACAELSIVAGLRRGGITQFVIGPCPDGARGRIQHHIEVDAVLAATIPSANVSSEAGDLARRNYVHLAAKKSLRLPARALVQAVRDVDGEVCWS